MALPVEISVTLGDQNSFHAPFKSSDGAFYVVGADFATSSLSYALGGDDLYIIGQNGSGVSVGSEVWRATDPTSSFSLQDNANRGGVGVNNEVRGVLFDVSSDTYTRDFLVDDTPNGTADACDIAVLSASYGVGSAFVKIRVVYQGATDMDMGGEFERIDLSSSVDDGVNWSAPTSIDSATGGAGLNYTGPRIVLPPSNSDQCHIFFSDGDPSDIDRPNIIQRAIAGDDTLRTYRDTGLDNEILLYPLTHGIGFLRSSISKVRIGYRERSSADLEVLEFDAFTDDTNPTVTTSNVSTDNVQTDNSSINACLAADGSVIRGLMVKSSDDDLYEFFDDDADSYTLQGTAHVTGTVNHISCNVYDRSGPKLAMIYDDGGTVYYDEIDLGGGADNLLADDVESASETSTPVIGQTHVITVTSAESASETSSPVVGQEHVLLADDVESASEVSAPAIAEVVPLLADDVESASEVTMPAIGQEHILAATSVESTSETSTPVVGQEHSLLADDVQSTSEVSAPVVEQEHVLLSTSVESASEVSAPAVSESNTLLADDVESASEVSAPTMAQIHALIASSVESASEVSLPGLGQEHILLAISAESTTELSLPVLAEVAGGRIMSSLAAAGGLAGFGGIAGPGGGLAG